jgi:hypothetical protein
VSAKLFSASGRQSGSVFQRVAVVTSRNALTAQLQAGNLGQCLYQFVGAVDGRKYAGAFQNGV